MNGARSLARRPERVSRSEKMYSASDETGRRGSTHFPLHPKSYAMTSVVQSLRCIVSWHWESSMIPKRGRSNETKPGRALRMSGRLGGPLRNTYLFLGVSLPLLVGAQIDSPQRLEPDKTVERTLSAGSSDSYTLDLHLRDLVSLKVTGKGQDVILSIFGPAGDLNRAFSSEVQNNGTIRFLASSRAGLWRLLVKARSKDSAAAYSISGVKITRASTAPPHVPDESPRIKAVKTSADVAAFWKEIGPEGSPLIESIKDDTKNRLVTFLWRGGEDTSGVLVAYPPCISENPEACMLRRLRGTDLWYLSLRVDSRARTYLRCVLNPRSSPKETSWGSVCSECTGNPESARST